MTSATSIASRLIAGVSTQRQIPLVHISREVERGVGLPALSPDGSAVKTRLSSEEVRGLVEVGILTVGATRLERALQVAVVAELIERSNRLLTVRRWRASRSDHVVGLWHGPDFWLTVVSDGTMSRYDICNEHGALETVFKITGRVRSGAIPSAGEFDPLDGDQADELLAHPDRIELIDHRTTPLEPVMVTVLVEDDHQTNIVLRTADQTTTATTCSAATALFIAGALRGQLG